jgi:hypothetical protein
MRWSSRGCAALATALALGAGAASAQQLVPSQGQAPSVEQASPVPAKARAPRLHFEVTVLHASRVGTGIDPGAERFDALLRDTVRYKSLRVVKAKERRVDLNEIERVALPTGNDFRFRPIDASDKGVLVAVDWRKTARGDFRLPRGKPLILGGQPYEGGQLVVILEAE